MKALVLAACLSVANAAVLDLDFNCTGLNNGLAWWGCKSFGVCDGEVHEQTDCLQDEAFDQVSGGCVATAVAAFPCNLERDCSALNDTVHRIPEMATSQGTVPCQYFYTCNYGNFAGHQECGEDLVYSETDQNCLSREFVEPPCGTLGSDYDY